MKAVLESGPWMVNNIPLVLNVWEPGIWLEKVEPSTIPIWVCVYNIPMELCNGNGLGKIMSGIGKPMLMDKMTRERCLKKSGKLDFARCLVEVDAVDELPNSLEISYPPLGNRPARVGKLEVKYQWKPPLCTHCKTFGHTTYACKIRPRSEEELAAKAAMEAAKLKPDGSMNVTGAGVVDDGFTEVGKKNRPVKVQTSGVQSRGYNQNRYGRDVGYQNRRFQNYGSQRYGNNGVNAIGQRRYGGVMQRNAFQQKSNVSTVNAVNKAKLVAKDNSGTVNTGQSKVDGLTVEKPKLASAFNHDFRPRVLVRGSGSGKDDISLSNENVPVSNSFQALDDQEMA